MNSTLLRNIVLKGTFNKNLGDVSFVLESGEKHTAKIDDDDLLVYTLSDGSIKYFYSTTEWIIYLQQKFEPHVVRPLPMTMHEAAKIASEVQILDSIKFCIQEENDIKIDFLDDLYE